MIVCESWFDQCGRPRGKIVRDTESGAVAFIPRDDDSPFPDKPWTHVDELREALDEAFNRRG